ARLDPYAAYEEAPARLACERGPVLQGIGVRLGYDAATGRVRVVTPIKDGPAHQAGIQAGDVITHIIRHVSPSDQLLDQPQVLATEGFSLPEMERALRGREGVPVVLRVVRAGADQPLEIEVLHGPAQPETVLGSVRKIDGSGDYLVDAEHRIGYL